MPDTRVLDKSLGSRHRAALGITEETDAVVVVVSEERGTISFCFNGNIVSNLDGASLRQALLGLFGQRSRAKKKNAPAPRKPAATAQTGSYRITLPLPEGQAARDSSIPPPSTATGSVLVTPMQPRVDPAAPLKTQPMQPAPMPAATPIETPKASAAIEPPTPPGDPER
jgi:hypothetical protein